MLYDYVSFNSYLSRPHFTLNCTTGMALCIMPSIKHALHTQRGTPIIIVIDHASDRQIADV